MFTMTTYDLQGAWQLTFGPQTAAAPATPAQLEACDWKTVPALVPGNVELDLMAAGLLPRELYKGNRIYDLRPYEFYRWWYRRTFDTPVLPPGHRAVLVLEGVDTLAEVFLNGVSVGVCRNMLIEHRFDLTDLLEKGKENTLAIRIDSAVLEGRRHRPDAIEFAGAVNWEALALRKAPHMYGWDILPRLVSAGLWRGVRIEIVPPTRLEDVYWTTVNVDAAQREAEVLVSWHIATDTHDIDGWKAVVQLYRKRGCVHRSEYPVHGTQGRVRLKLKEVDLWWPRGSGEPALHNAGVVLFDDKGNKLDEHHIRLGIRTVELRRTETTDERGAGEFVFLVNGRKVYCRGTNHVPLDALHSRDAQHVLKVLPMLSDLNCNMVRCWGGNVYEDKPFFDYCDKHGIMVWQDFAMACAVYPQTEAFAREIRTEAEAIVRKLRNHPSLVLWAGNNEIDQVYGGWSGLNLDPNTDVLSRQVLPEVVRRLDPWRTYLPSSPCYSPAIHAQGNPHQHSPEDHLWGPRDDFKGPYYTTSSAHFVSEIGYHGCPSRETMEAMMDPESLWPWQDNDQWLTHSVRSVVGDHQCDYRIPLMASQIRVLFDRDPENLDDYILASQASQAESLKYFIERWRIGKWRRTGMLWWNLRDGWPVISDAIVDYFGRRKLAYEVVKRVQADLCISIAESEQGTHRVYALNDSPTPAEMRVEITEVGSDKTLFAGPVRSAADASVAVAQVGVSAYPAMWRIDWTGTQAGQAIAGVNHYLAGPRPFKLDEYRQWLKGVGL